MPFQLAAILVNLKDREDWLGFYFLPVQNGTFCYFFGQRKKKNCLHVEMLIVDTIFGTNLSQRI